MPTLKLADRAWRSDDGGGAWWAWIAAVVSPVVGLAIALPLHYTGAFVIGALMALAGMMGRKPATA